MLVAGLVVSAVAVLLGLITKLPQGGGGLVNNLMVMSCFLSIAPPPLYHPPPFHPNAVFYDIDAVIFDPRKAYGHQNGPSCNLTQSPMPQCHTRSGIASEPLINATFPTPILSLPSLSPLLLILGKVIAEIFVIFVALSLPWLACTQLPLLAKIQKATDDSLTTATVSGRQWTEIEIHHRLLYDLQTAMSEHSKDLEEVESVKTQAREQSERATEREREMEQGLKGLEKQRDDAILEGVRAREDLERLEKEKEEETERLNQEMNRQMKASEVKERIWEEKRAEGKKRYVEEKERMKMGREKERENWMKQVERLRKEKGEEEELQSKIKKISKEKEEEKTRWEREKEEDLRKQEKLEMELEERWRSLEAQRLAKSDALEIAKNLAQQRIAELEEENSKLRNEAMEREKMAEERQAARAISEGERSLEKNRWEEQMAEAKELLSKMQEDLLSGRKLIEDLQTDKRIDRQLLVELRAQLARPTQQLRPTHPSPLRFDGTAYSVLAAPNFIPAPVPSTSSSPKVALPSSRPIIPPTTLPPIVSSGSPARPDVASPVVRLPPTNPESRPIVRLPLPPPTRKENPSRLPMGSRAPVDAPRGPKGWRPNVPKPT